MSFFPRPRRSIFLKSARSKSYRNQVFEPFCWKKCKRRLKMYTNISTDKNCEILLNTLQQKCANSQSRDFRNFPQFCCNSHDFSAIFLQTFRSLPMPTPPPPLPLRVSVWPNQFSVSVQENFPAAGHCQPSPLSLPHYHVVPFWQSMGGGGK